jgi:hypothetical protein
MEANPSLLMSTFCVAATAGTLWPAFFTSLLLHREGASVSPLRRGCRLGGGMDKVIAGITVKTSMKDEGWRV